MKKTLLKAGILCLAVTGMYSSHSAVAQSDPTGMKRITDTYAITNASVITAPGKSPVKSTILIKNGVIQGIGTDLTLPKQAKIISGDSLYVYPGFISGASDAGITKPKDPERPDDFVSSDPPDEIAGITPWRSALDQYDAKDSKVEDLRKTGFTIAQIIPGGGMLAGKSAIVLLGSEHSTNLLEENTAVAASFEGSRGMYPGTAVGVMAKFRDIYHNTKLTRERAEKYASVAGVKRPEVTPTYKSMEDVVNGSIPVLFSAASDLEIRRAIGLQKELGFDLILTDLEDYERVIDLIKSSGTKVLVKLEIPDDKAVKEQKKDATEEVAELNAKVKKAYGAALSQAGKLEAAGIPFAFTTAGVKPEEILKSLKVMIENGLSEAAALASLTTNAAAILGISREAGTIEKGKMANLILSTDSVFGKDAQIRHVMVDGYLYDYETKEKKKSNKNGESEEPVIEGDWEYTSETPAGSSGGIITIKKEGADYTGTITYDDPGGSGKATSTLSDIALEENTLTFSFDVNAGGTKLTVDITVEIEDDSLEGTMEISQYGAFPIQGTRTPSLITNK